MNMKTFYKQIRRAQRAGYRARIDEYGVIEVRPPGKNYCFCSINAVHHLLTQNIVGNQYTHDVGLMMGLALANRDRIIDANDDNFHGPIITRNRLLEAWGIQVA